MRKARLEELVITINKEREELSREVGKLHTELHRETERLLNNLLGAENEINTLKRISRRGDEIRQELAAAKDTIEDLQKTLHTRTQKMNAYRRLLDAHVCLFTVVEQTLREIDTGNYSRKVKVTHER